MNWVSILLSDFGYSCMISMNMLDHTAISNRFYREKVMEGDNINGLKHGKQSISLEPTGQFELSDAPLESLHQSCAEVNSHLYQGRYEIMRNYMPKVGSLRLDMMFRTCTVQKRTLTFEIDVHMVVFRYDEKLRVKLNKNW
uniref:Uncharacterized protein n=1 Tax=Lactuca sativa TaxID=4236 RepID=A0A9R1WNH8_LACSA|nr:hypothetical protein LSAT_V11C900455210 [Lactuca sativa]